MSRFAPPLAEVGSAGTSYVLGDAGWLVALIVLAHLCVIAVGYPQILELFAARPVAVFFVYFAALTSLLLLIGSLLLLARFPSSMLLFVAALVSSLLEFRNHHSLLPFVGLAAAVGCLCASIKIFLVRGHPTGRRLWQ
jgi:hypothetical protein